MVMWNIHSKKFINEVIIYDKICLCGFPNQTRIETIDEYQNITRYFGTGISVWIIPWEVLKIVSIWSIFDVASNM